MNIHPKPKRIHFWSPMSSLSAIMESSQTKSPSLCEQAAIELSTARSIIHGNSVQAWVENKWKSCCMKRKVGSLYHTLMSRCTEFLKYVYVGVSYFWNPVSLCVKENIVQGVKSECLTGVTTNRNVFLDVTPYSPVHTSEDNTLHKWGCLRTR